MRSPVAINRQSDIAAISSDGTAILSRNGARTLIGGLVAQDMNDRREVVGAIGKWPATTAAIWSQTTGIRGLGTLGGVGSYAYGINNEGEVVGASTTSSGEVHAFYWSVSRGMVDLGPGEAYAISDRGHMVGIAPTGLIDPWTEREVWHATLWRGTGGVTPPAVTVRSAAAPTGPAAACFNDATNWQSKTQMLPCLAGRR
jgi:probable HAF family extracellular repeat protein